MQLFRRNFQENDTFAYFIVTKASKCRLNVRFVVRNEQLLVGLLSRQVPAFEEVLTQKMNTPASAGPKMTPMEPEE